MSRHSRPHPASRLRKQPGFTLIEVMITLGILGGIIALVLVYQSRAEGRQAANQTASGLTLMASSVKTLLGPSNDYSALSPSWLNSAGLVVSPFKYDGTNVLDQWGNTMSASGGTTTFALTIGGATTPLDKDVCTSIATKIVEGATDVAIGDATVASGKVAGTNKYRTNGGVPDGTKLASGCNTPSPVIAVQYR